MRALRDPLAALLTFIIGVIVSPIHFQVEGMGYGRAIDGDGGFSITTYRSSYFVKVSYAYVEHSSPDKANTTFDEMLAEAVDVIALTPKLDEHGNAVGRRALAILTDKETDKQFACVFWTGDKTLYSINSFSLLHVLEFEKQQHELTSR